MLVQQVVQQIRAYGATSVRNMDGVVENLKFPLPKGLKLDSDS